MQKLTFILALLFLNILSYGQSAYQTAMLAAINSMNGAKTIPDLQKAANQFDRIGSVAEKEWLPGYYAAFAAIQISFIEKEAVKRDMYLDKAQGYLDQIQKVAAAESELYALQGLLHQGRIQVSPMDRGQKYFMLSEEALEKAKALDENNPRPYYLSGQSKFYMPTAFGGGPAAALPLLTMAREKFNTFKPTSDIAPNWGLSTTQYLLQKCQTTSSN